jgi:hypothetical protein
LDEYTFKIEIGMPDFSANITPRGDTSKMLFKLLGDVEGVAAHTTVSVRESAEWTAILNAVEENRASYCKGLH